MEKYKFDRKLQETVLKIGTGQQTIIIIDGEERKVRCPVFAGTGARAFPCLVEKVRETENAVYDVVAFSFDDVDKKEKDWICIQPVFLEQVIGVFLEKHQMEDMVKDYGNISRVTDTKDSGFDFESENVCMEIKVPIPVAVGTDSCTWNSFHQAVKQMIGYRNSSYCKGKGKRIILLTICQHGTRQIQSMIDGSIEELEKATKAGIEFWIAETKTGPDGVELLSYCDITCNILNG